ncbi:MAG: adenylyltransferase/cytidyltransferase family protein, partial [Candidatus Eremiobacteraeota bacterium]|nr:adenylyltransferase/cytidyltransferase family protein [Candidatus Eremiobacteraeota bacterium]
MTAADRVVSREALAARIATEHGAGARVVFTNGVFDLLHVGHIRYLESARSLGDMLVVA